MKKQSEPEPEAQRPKRPGPNFNVPFKLVPAATLSLEFTDRHRPDSPYRRAISELLKPANEGQALEFTANTSARTLLPSTPKSSA